MKEHTSYFAASWVCRMRKRQGFAIRKQNNELIARLKAIEESNKENSKALIDTINELSATVENYRKEMELMRKQLEAKDEVNRMLANEISNLRLQLEDSRKHRFGRTSEQRRLLNNRNLDKSAMEWISPSMTVLNFLLYSY